MFRKRFLPGQGQSRAKKAGKFFQRIRLTSDSWVLNLGGALEDGLMDELHSRGIQRGVMLNLDRPSLVVARQKSPDLRVVQADARALPFATGAVDAIYSNAVIEHVGDWSHQQQFASEVRRVGRSYFITTPNKYFPIELHYHVPFFQFYPRWLQRWLNQHFDLGWVKRGEWLSLDLLSAGQMRQLFPDGDTTLQRITLYPETIISCRVSEMPPNSLA